MLIYIVKHLHVKFQGSQGQVAQSKTLIALQSTVGAKWSFDSQKFKFLVNISFWSHKHHLINAWSWFSKFGSEIIKDAKVAIFGQLKKVNWNWPGHNFHMDYQKNSIQSSFWRERHFLQLIFILQVQEMLSQKVINFNIIGHFQKSTKRDFKSKAITWDW